MMSDLVSSEIIQLLENTGNKGYFIKRRIREKALVGEIIKALETSTTSRVRQILCDILGERQAEAALPLLIKCLDDPSPDVRSSAADALAKIHNPSAGGALMRRFVKQKEDMGVRRMLAAALGAVSYRPAIPVLIQALSHPDGSLRGSAAWSLGALNAREAVEPLGQALSYETNSYATTRMREALGKIAPSTNSLGVVPKATRQLVPAY
jgi:HEAT repeat protein